MGSRPGKLSRVWSGGSVSTLLTAGDIEAEQYRVVLTAHPLQRVGAFALVALAKAESVDDLHGAVFQDAVAVAESDAVRAACAGKGSENGRGWWHGVISNGFFPNSPLHYASRWSDSQTEDEVHNWRRLPPAPQWPEAPCVLCGRQAVGFYGKRDVPLGESTLYRNTTPPGHEGIALCYPCLCCFHALPYGCVLAGGPAAAVHSWDDRMLLHLVEGQVQENRRLIGLGEKPAKAEKYQRELTALNGLRNYPREPSGVELIVFSNSNRDAILDIHAMEQPLAAWLRQVRRHTWTVLCRAHRNSQISDGERVLARSAFVSPDRIAVTAIDWLVRVPGGRMTEAATVMQVCRSYAEQVIGMSEKDIEEIESLGARIATLVIESKKSKPLMDFFVQYRKEGRDLRRWLERHAIDWAANQPTDGPLLTMGSSRALFDAGVRTPLNRHLLLVAVLAELHQRGWAPQLTDEDKKELADAMRRDSDSEEGDE